MEDMEFSLVKKKIIKMNDVIKILSDKNYNLNRLIDKLKILYFKYREKSNEVYALRTALEMCKLELEPLKIDHTALLSRYHALEEEHKCFVNNSEFKYQKVCADLDRINQAYNLVMSRKPEHCTSCTSQIERNKSLSKEVKSLKMQILQNNDRLSADLNIFTENHAKELAALKTRHVIEMQRIENKYAQELDTSNSRLKHLEARETELKEENKALQEQLIDIKPSNLTVSITHVDECDLKPDCCDLDDDIVYKCIWECKYLPNLLSPIAGDEMESDIYEMEIDAEITETERTTDKCEDTQTLPTDDNISKTSDGELNNTIKTENTYSNITDIQIRYALRRKTLKAKQIRHKKLKQNILRTLFKYIDRRLVQAKTRAVAEHNRKCAKQNMSQSYRSKRKLQMMRWKYLREVCFSSTDSEHDSRLVRHTARTRKKKNNQWGKENLMKLIRKVNGHYDSLTSGFDDLSQYYHTLNLDDSYICDKVDTTGDSGYSGKSEPELCLPDITERVSVISSIDDSLNDLSSHCDETIAKFDSSESNSNLEVEIALTQNSIVSNDEELCVKLIEGETNDECDKNRRDEADVKLRRSPRTLTQNSILTRKEELCGEINETEINDHQRNEGDIKLRKSPRKTVQANKRVGKNLENLLRRMKKNLNGCKRGEINLENDVSTQYCGKKRISHCNIVKPVGSQHQKEDNSNTVNDDNHRNSINSINLIERDADKRNMDACDVIKSANVEFQFKIPMSTSSSHGGTVCRNNNSSSRKLHEKVTDNIVKSNIDQVCRENHEVHCKNSTPSHGSTVYLNNNSSSIELIEKVAGNVVKSNVEAELTPVKSGVNFKIPTNIPSSHGCTVHLKKLITFPDESTIFAEVVSALSTKDADSIIRCVLHEVSMDINSKPDKQYTPPAPILTGAQRVLLALLARLQKESFPHLLDEFMSKSELFILEECNVQNIQPVTRLYLAVCKLTRNLDRMRRMACDTLYFLGDLSIPFLFTVLSTWIEVLPLQQDGDDNPLVKVLVQVVNLKACVSPGYNLLPLRKLLQGYFGYPTERWNSDDVFKDIFSNFTARPSKFLEYCLLILCKNHPWKWTSAQIEAHLKPILDSNCDNLTLRKTILSLLKNIIAGVDEDIADFSIKYDGCC